MNIDRKKVENEFKNYVKDYDISNPKIELKVIHTTKVAEISEDIAVSLKLEKEECDLAWLIGILHDIGRFEQLRQYNTFADSISVDHALLGCDILFEDGLIRRFSDDTGEDALIRTAISNHSRYRIDENMDDRTRMFTNILRDADKIDIIRVQLDTPLEDIYNISTKELKESEVSAAVMDSFKEKHAVLRSLKSTGVDYVVGSLSLAYELVYDRSREIMNAQGYLQKLAEFESLNPKTAEQFEYIRKYLKEYMSGTPTLKN